MAEIRIGTSGSHSKHWLGRYSAHAVSNALTLERLV